MALSLTPALCATLLKPVEAGHHHEKRGFFGWFNRGFSRTAKGYEGVVARMLAQGAALPDHLRGHHRRRRAAGYRACPPRSCRPKTRAT